MRAADRGRGRRHWRAAALACAVGAVVGAADSGCAGRTQTPPVPGQGEAGPGPAAAEEFDPARFREDLLLIQPVVPPAGAPGPAVTPGAGRGPRSGQTPAGSRPAATGGPAGTVYRVQVMALSRPDRARAVADQVAARFGVPAEVVSEGGLFHVLAGRFAEPAAAGQFKGRLAVASREYADAFVVADTTGADDEPPAALDTAAATGGQAAPELVRVQGWRVLLGQFYNREGAAEYQARVQDRLQRSDVEILFEEPWFKVVAGSFRTPSAAQVFAERCRELGYGNATRVPGEVYLPREDEER